MATWLYGVCLSSYKRVKERSHTVDKRTSMHLVAYRTPCNYWARHISFGWSKNGHANSVAAVQFCVVASGCGPKKLQKSEREKPHSGRTKSLSPTKTPCNQPAIAILTHTQTQHRRSTQLA